MVCWPFMVPLMTNNYLQVTCHESQVPAMSLRFSKPLTWTCSWLMIWVPEPVGHILTGQMQVQDRSTHGLTWTYVQLYHRGPDKCAELGQEVLHQVSQSSKALDIVRARPLGGGYCHDRTPGTLLFSPFIVLCLSSSRTQPCSRACLPLLCS